MCIRDRKRAARAVRRRGDSRPRHAGRQRREGPGVDRHQPGTCEAVSYTHLRAHETVLDLVCRLLLEKKKKNIKKKKRLTKKNKKIHITFQILISQIQLYSHSN